MKNNSIEINRGTYVIDPESIIRVQGLSNYSKIYFVNSRPLVVSKILYWFEGQLPKNMFFRVHRSHLVNKHFIKEINGTITKTLVLINGESIIMSRKKKEQQMYRLLENSK